MGAARYYIGGTLILALCTSTSIALIRGGTLSVGASPISMSDATLYINNPSHTSLILSNPFCIIRTSGKGDINYT